MGTILKAMPMTKAVSTSFANCALVLRCGKLRLSLSERVVGGAYCRFLGLLKTFLSLVQTSYGRLDPMSISRTLNPLCLHGNSCRSKHPIGPAPLRRPHLARRFERFLDIDGAMIFSESSSSRERLENSNESSAVSAHSLEPVLAPRSGAARAKAGRSG